MTAVILATFVERGTLTWETAIGDVFTELASGFSADFRAITVTQLLSHDAGLPATLPGARLPRRARPCPNSASTRSRGRRRRSCYRGLERSTNTDPRLRPCWRHRRARRRKAVGRPDARLVFTPLGMTSCGFGGLGTPGTIDQPWPHTANGQPTSSNGPAIDNAAALVAAGTVHCTIADWSKFIAESSCGANAARARSSKWKRIKDSTRLASEGATHSAGASPHECWAGGRVSQHSGSNTTNFCVVWVAPLRDHRVLAVTNQAGDAAQQAPTKLWPP